MQQHICTGGIKHSDSDISKVGERLGCVPEYDFELSLNKAIARYKEIM